MVEDTAKPDCSPERLEEIRAVLDQVATKWSILILTMLCDGPVRFNDLRRRVGDVTQKSLTEALRRLERNRLISRCVIASSPIAVQYEITDLGKTLEVPVFALVRWAEHHAAEMLADRDALENQTEESTA